MRGSSDVFYTAAQFCLCNETFLCLGMHFRSPRLHLLCRYCGKRSRGRKEQFWIFHKLQFGFEKYFVIQMLCLYCSVRIGSLHSLTRFECICLSSLWIHVVGCHRTPPDQRSSSRSSPNGFSSLSFVCPEDCTYDLIRETVIKVSCLFVNAS